MAIREAYWTWIQACLLRWREIELYTSVNVPLKFLVRYNKQYIVYTRTHNRGESSTEKLLVIEPAWQQKQKNTDKSDNDSTMRCQI